MLDELVVIASIGTSRKAPTFSAISPAIDDALRPLSTESAEEQLLGAAALLSRYQCCGRKPAPAALAPNPPGPESLPTCTRRAADLLWQFLSMPNNDTQSHLISEWLELARGAGKRAPYRLLPGLLDYAASHKTFRRSIIQVAGARGDWLMGQNARWKFEVEAGEDPGSVWSTGTRDHRLAALRRAREADPAAGLELIRSTWKEDSAEDRSSFVTAILPSLGAEDEAFLESCLDDRSKQVRGAAADVLARLPQSAYVQRMTGRADPLLRFTAAKKSGLLRKPTPAKVEIELPADQFASDWARDGIAEKPEGKLGRRQWWLQRFVAAVPLRHWSTIWNATPDECIAALTGDFADVVLSAWHQAALRHPDPAWITALLLAARNGRGPMTLELLNHLPPDARRDVAADILESPQATLQVMALLLRTVNGPIDRRATRAIVDQIERHIEQQSAGYVYLIAPVLQSAALRVIPDLYDELADCCAGARWESNRKALDEFLQTFQIRRDLHREFKA